MIGRIVILSLIITAIHVCTWEGMIFFRPANALGEFLDRLHLSVLRKPLFECLVCMGGVWTIIVYPVLFGFSWQVLPTMVAVIGLNSIIATYLHSHD